MAYNLESIEFHPELVSFIIKNKDLFVDEWVNYPTVYDVQKKMNFSKDQFRDNVAIKVTDYFITLLNSENKPGDCPVMREVVNQFYNHGLYVEDVFTNCTALKNIIVLHVSRSTKKTVNNHVEDIMIMFDYNLKNILSMYSQKISSHEKRLKEKASIIDENVLFSKTDIDGKITQVSDAFCQLTGYTKDELIGKTHAVLRDPDVKEKMYKKMWDTIKSGKVWQGSFSNIKKDGSKFIANVKIKPLVENDKIIGYMALRYDVTANELAKIDPLTSLYNRSSFEKSFSKKIKEAARGNYEISLLVLDLDHFKSINDNYGHLKGDEILQQFADVLRNNTRSNDTCSRWGGEEFAVLLPDSDLQTAYTIAERIRESTVSSLSFDERVVSCSIGIAQKKEDESYEELFKRADKYLYEAKFGGRNRCVKG